mgnify:CR=1 FL=1
MARLGRPPTPSPLKILRGETRPSRLNRTEPRPTKGRPHMPADMSEAAKVIWRRVLHDYRATGVITPVDGYVLRVFCEAAARYAHASRLLDESGPLIRGARRGERVKSPLHQIVRDNADLVRAFGGELGLTPTSRTRLTGGGEPEPDPAEEFLHGRFGT